MWKALRQAIGAAGEEFEEVHVAEELELLADFGADVAIGSSLAGRSDGMLMKTVAEWLKKHPNVIARVFERNYRKESGSGVFEAVCGFCLASHYFKSSLRKNCTFCGAPFREARSISNLPEVRSQRWRLLPMLTARSQGNRG